MDGNNERRLIVFLCHSSGDKPAVRALYKRLQTEGIQPWLDEEDLIAGQVWESVIRKAVRGCDIVLVCLSKSSITKVGYIQKEIRDVLEEADRQPEGSIFVIPLKLEECDIPERLSKWQWVNYFEENGYERLMRALRLRAQALDITLKPVSAVPSSPTELLRVEVSSLKGKLEEPPASFVSKWLKVATLKDTLQPGPVGDYLEVVDVDPASGCFYAPVDLNKPYLLAQDELPLSEANLLAQDGLALSAANPQFHQQMVYLAAMTTIRNFERALGRVAFWSPHYSVGPNGQGQETLTESYVQRLRIYPHALLEANAYYSPQKKALLFGYFPASSSALFFYLPESTIFTCLSQDIVAHETTHALLDGMHRRFEETSNPDVLAFHEAFADIVALYQHFSFPEVLRHQIAMARGDLASENLLAQLAQEFGQVTGSHGALRDALGAFDENGIWQPKEPDPTVLYSTSEPHARGSLLVAAVLDAFVSIYKSRITDLLRTATGGTGVLPAGQLHPDLVNRMASEAAKSAQHVLNICIRALDYCPPVDLTFGDYLRALITADYDLVRDDDLGYRIAIVKAFRQWGIYPYNMRWLSIDNLRWQEPTDPDFHPRLLPMVQKLSGMIQEWNLSGRREEVYKIFRRLRAELHAWLKDTARDLQDILGLDLRKPDARFEVHSLRPARRVGPDGELLLDLVIEITQQKAGYFDPNIQDQVDNKGMDPAPPADFVFRGGCTLLVDPETPRVRYCISKNILSADRLERQRQFLMGGSGGTSDSLRAIYFKDAAQKEPFAFLHRSVE